MFIFNIFNLHLKKTLKKVLKKTLKSQSKSQSKPQSKLQTKLQVKPYEEAQVWNVWQSLPNRKERSSFGYGSCSKFY